MDAKHDVSMHCVVEEYVVAPRRRLPNVTKRTIKLPTDSAAISSFFKNPETGQFVPVREVATGRRHPPADGEILIAQVCIEPHDFALLFSVPLTGHGDSVKIDFFLAGSWRVCDPCLFVNSFASNMTKPSSPLVKSVVEDRIANILRPSVRDECRKHTAEDLIGKDALPADCWHTTVEKNLRERYGLIVEIRESCAEEEGKNTIQRLRKLELHQSILTAEEELLGKRAEIERSKRKPTLSERMQIRRLEAECEARKLRFKRYIDQPRYQPVEVTEDPPPEQVRDGAVVDGYYEASPPETAPKAVAVHPQDCRYHRDRFSFLVLLAEPVLFLLALVGPLAVIVVSEAAILKRLVVRGNRLALLLGAVGAVVWWTIGISVRLISHYIWPRCPYGSDFVPNRKSILRSLRPVFFHVHEGSRKGVGQSWRSWADVVLALGETDIEDLGRYDFFRMWQEEPLTSRDWYLDLPGVRQHGACARIVVTLATFAVLAALTIIICLVAL